MPRYSLILNRDDLARVRLLRSPDPLEEMIFAAHLMMPVLRNDPILGGWTRRTVKSLGVAGRDVLAVLDSAFVQISDLGHTNKGVVRTFDDVIESVRSLPPSGWGAEVALAANPGITSSLGRSLANGRDGAIDHLESA